jgi:3-methyladenine DNA glycosylase AlkD
MKQTPLSQLNLTAKQFLEKLTALRSAQAGDNSKFFHDSDKKNKFLGIRMSNIFTLAKQFMQMPAEEIEKLLSSDFYEARMGAVSVMDFKARDKKITDDEKRALYELYINRHDRINNWDLVDRSAPHVVGGYLFDKSRKQLYKLAQSKNTWERRTAIVSTWYFIRQNDVDDTFKIAALLIDDKEELVNKAVGSWIREAGKRDKQQLLNFLDKYAPTMPRITLRYAIEKLDKKQKDFYLGLKK